MSDAHWPDLGSPYPEGERQPQHPAMPPYAPRQGASPYEAPASRPLAPYGSYGAPDAGNQYGQPSQYDPYGQPSQSSQYDAHGRYGSQGQYEQPEQSSQYGQLGQYGQYGQQLPSLEPAPGGQPGYPGAAYDYRQPQAPSQPMYPYPYPPDDPTMQSTPYSRPAESSQALSPYAQPEAPSRSLAPHDRFGPSSRALAPGRPPAGRKRSLTWLWIVLGVLVVLLAAGGGGAVYVVSQLGAPATAATQFCNDLKTQSYDAAYALLSSSMHAQYTHDQFVQGSQALDQIEGQVTSCQPATSGSGYHYSFGADTASIMAVIARPKQPASLTGALRLVSEGGSWKISGIDTALLGVNLGALRTATTFCAALQSKDYATATGLFDSSLHVAQSDWGTWDQIGGEIKTCALQGLGTGNTDSAASFEVVVTRANNGNQTGALSLALESGAWKVTKLGSGVLGPDLGPLKVGGQFCQDILSANYSDAYGLLSSGLQQTIGSKDKLAADFVLPSGVYFANCTAKLSSYKVNGSSGGYEATLALSNGSQSANVTMSLSFVEQGNAWKVDNWNFSLG